MLWHIALKFCIWLYFTVLQIKFKCCQFASIFVGVMPLLELKNWKYTVFRSFLLHALTYCCEILHMTLFYCTTDQVWVSSISVNFCRSYALFGTENTGNTQFSALSSYMLWPIDLKFCMSLSSYKHSIKFECRQFSSIFVGVMPLFFITWNTRNTRYSALFSYMFWHIELKFYVWLYFTILQIKLECGQFPSIFVVVMPLLGLRILEIHSFLLFSPTCIDKFSWNLKFRVCFFNAFLLEKFYTKITF